MGQVDSQPEPGASSGSPYSASSADSEAFRRPTRRLSARCTGSDGSSARHEAVAPGPASRSGRLRSHGGPVRVDGRRGQRSARAGHGAREEHRRVPGFLVRRRLVRRRGRLGRRARGRRGLQSAATARDRERDRRGAVNRVVVVVRIVVPVVHIAPARGRRRRAGRRGRLGSPVRRRHRAVRRRDSFL
ncbi:hypothetical protein M885DRAFT_514675 [Pelagophyceae sp. CCMP2097]|nr:hypothetical protein M885DRAFT_514675 [Pelagophyceae sp. CCMP2097]